MHNNKYDEIKIFLDEIVMQVNTPDFIEEDPIQFPRKFELIQDQEIAGLLTALISWGKRSMILKNAEKMFQLIGRSPYDWVMNQGFKDLDTGVIHRTFNYADLRFIGKGLHYLYHRYDSMEIIFKDKDMFDGIAELRKTIIEGNQCPGFRSEKHLANPEKNSACKRLHMFLKWMVRNDQIVDMGVWKNILPASLYIPLDVHVINISRHFGLLTRTQNDRKAVEELTALLRSFCPEDPVKYDYALFGIGIKGLI